MPIMKAPLLIDSVFIEINTSFIELVQALNAAFSKGTTIVPQRHHHDFPNPGRDKDNTLLLMPAYNPGEDLGVKAVTINPHNNELKLPAIQGSYLYMDATNGKLKAIIEAKNEKQNQKRKRQLEDMAYMLANVCGALGAKKKSGASLTMDDFLPDELKTKEAPTLNDLFNYLKRKTKPNKDKQ